METMKQTVTIERVDQPTFERAYHNGQQVAVVNDQHFWTFNDNSIGSRHSVPGPVGFTNANVRLEDVYADGPARPGDLRYWIVTPASEASEL